MTDTNKQHIIIGTAGHIDHGKTTLIKALTGKSTDRLKEEQKRGISIDLGFGYFDTQDGTRIGIIDVPGHEHFVNNMVAGVVGMDVVLLVIAADEGIMPQTREHIDILELLGIKNSIIVLNKTDLVDKEWLELVKDDIKRELTETFLKDAPIVEVSSTTGEGLDKLKKVIETVIKQNIRKKVGETVPYLPIDRVFTITGSGTIVTGTLISGFINTDSEMEIYPIEKFCRIRSIQVHGKPTQVACSGQRVALNFSNIKKEELYRGCVVAEKNSLQPTNLINVRIQCLKSSKRTIKNNSRLHFFSGTTEALCRIVLLDCKELYPGEQALAQLKFDKNIVLRKNDKFVVRFFSPLETIGGGTVIEVNAKKIKRFDVSSIKILNLFENGSLKDVILAYLNSSNEPVFTIQRLAKMTSTNTKKIEETIAALEQNSLVSSYKINNQTYVWGEKNKKICIKKVLDKLTDFHNNNPYKPGLYKAEIYEDFFKNTKRPVFDVVIEDFVNKYYLNRSNEFLYASNFKIKKDETYKQIENIILTALDQAKFNFVWFSDIDFNGIFADASSGAFQEEIDDVLRCLIAENKVTKISENLFTLPKYVNEAKEKIIKKLKQDGRITIAEVRDMFNTTRKTAKPILEYMDKLGITKKTGGEAEREAGNLSN